MENDIIVDIPNVGQVAFPSSMSEADINAAAKRLYDESTKQAPTQEAEPSMLSQYGRQLGLTTRAAIQGIAGLPNFIADPFAELVGIKPPSQALRQSLTTMGLPEPETRIERMAGAGAEAMAGAGSQISLARQAAQQLTSPVSRNVAGQLAQAPGTQLTAAGVAAPTAQQVTEATEIPVAGMAAGVLAGGAVGMRRQPQQAPVAEQLRRQANAAYTRAENAGLEITPGFMDRLSTQLRTLAYNEGFDPGMHPELSRVIRRLEEERQTPQTLRDIERLRRIVKAPGRKFDNPDQQRIAGDLIDEFDNLVGNLTPQDITAGNRNVALGALRDARNIYQRSRKVSVIEDMVDAAQTRAAQQTQAGLDNTLRNQFASLATNRKRMAAFSRAEQAEIRRIARGGGTVQQMLRFTGRFAVRGPVSGIFAGGATAMEPTIGLPLTLTAEGAKRGAEALRQRDVSRLIEQLAQQQIPRQPSLVPISAMRGLLSSQQE
jgi:hypothetical protein